MTGLRKYFSDKRAIAYAVATIVALTAMKFGFFNTSIGLLFGVVMSFGSVVESEGEDLSLGKAVGVLFLGIVLWITGLVVAQQHGVTVEELRTLRDLPKFVRSLPFLGNLCVGAGSFLVLANLIGTQNAPSQE